MTDKERLNYVYEKLTQLPFFTPKKVSDHLVMKIDRAEPEKTGHLLYKIKSELSNEPGVADKIHKTISEAADNVGILLVSEL